MPQQVIDGPFPIGVVAFHMNEIDRVEFSADNGPWVSVDEMVYDPRTEVWEYTVLFDPEAFVDGEVEVRAIAYPEVGTPRVLEPLTLYANAEDWSPSEDDPAPRDRNLLDRWLISRLSAVVTEVRSELNAYQLTRAYRTLGEFLSEELSNWYVRRSRPRFWGNTDEDDARAAFRTLWEALGTVCLLSAPVTPFVSDWIYRGLTGESVHLEAFPGDGSTDGLADRDESLEREVEAVRALVSVALSAVGTSRGTAALDAQAMPRVRAITMRLRIRRFGEMFMLSQVLVFGLPHWRFPIPDPLDILE